MDKENELDEVVRANIRKIMDAKELSYTDLQRLTGIDRATLHKYIKPDDGKTGKRRMTVSRAIVIADALGVDITELAGRK